MLHLKRNYWANRVLEMVRNQCGAEWMAALDAFDSTNNARVERDGKSYQRAGVLWMQYCRGVLVHPQWAVSKQVQRNAKMPFCLCFLIGWVGLWLFVFFPHHCYSIQCFTRSTICGLLGSRGHQCLCVCGHGRSVWHWDQVGR